MAKKMTIVAASATTAILAAIIVASVATAAILAGCAKVEDDKNIDKAWTCHGNDCCTKVVEVEGHEYIIMDGFYSGGIIHAASCWCMNK